MPIISCHQGGAGFEAMRSTARDRSPRCRKAKSRDTTAYSPAEDRKSLGRFDLNNVQLETSAKLPLKERPAYLETLIDRALAAEARIKEVLSSPCFLGAGCQSNRHVDEATIAKRSVWGVVHAATAADQAHRAIRKRNSQSVRKNYRPRAGDFETPARYLLKKPAGVL